MSLVWFLLLNKESLAFSCRNLSTLNPPLASQHLISSPIRKLWRFMAFDDVVAVAKCGANHVGVNGHRRQLPKEEVPQDSPSKKNSAKVQSPEAIAGAAES